MELNKVINMKVNGIHCGGCSKKIKAGLAVIDQTSMVEVNTETGHVVVKYNSDNLTISKIKDSITGLGFSVESVEIE